MEEPGLVALDCLFYEGQGSSFHGLVAFSQGEGHVRVGDPDGSGDEPGDQVVGCSAPSPGCFGPTARPGDGAQRRHPRPRPVNVPVQGPGRVVSMSRPRASASRREEKSGPRASLVAIACSWASPSADRPSRASQRSVWATAAMVWYSAARVAMLSASCWARRMASWAATSAPRWRGLRPVPRGRSGRGSRRRGRSGGRGRSGCRRTAVGVAAAGGERRRAPRGSWSARPGRGRCRPFGLGRDGRWWRSPARRARRHSRRGAPPGRRRWLV